MPNEAQATPAEQNEKFNPNELKKTEEAPTYGMKAVGYSFNPSGDDHVATAKRGFATLIDQANDLRNATASPEQKRLASIAITEAQAAQMWLVKAITWRD